MQFDHNYSIISTSDYIPNNFWCFSTSRMVTAILVNNTSSVNMDLNLTEEMWNINILTWSIY